jgi:hypothetical protein
VLGAGGPTLCQVAIRGQVGVLPSDCSVAEPSRMPGSTLVLHALLSVSLTLSIHPPASRFPQSSLALSRGFASGVSGDRLPFAWAALRGGSEPIRESRSTAFPQGSAGKKHDVGVQSESEVLGKMLKAMEELVSLDGNSSNFATTRRLWAAFNFSEGHTRVEGEKGRIPRQVTPTSLAWLA